MYSRFSNLWLPAAMLVAVIVIAMRPTRFEQVPDGTYKIKASALTYNGRRAMAGQTQPEFCFISFRLPDGVLSPSLAPYRILVSAFPGDPQVRVYHDTSGTKHVELVVPPSIMWASEIPEHQRLGGNLTLEVRQ